MLCRDCGYVPQCPNCDISLTYHKTSDQLKCHYCGYQETPPNLCPNCESDHIRQVGTGTQRRGIIISRISRIKNYTNGCRYHF